VAKLLAEPKYGCVDLPEYLGTPIRGTLNAICLTGLLELGMMVTRKTIGDLRDENTRID
jgi:hypothetical protein